MRVDRLEALLCELVPNADIDKLLASSSSSLSIRKASEDAAISFSRRSTSDSSVSPDLATRNRQMSESDELLAVSPAMLELDGHESADELDDSKDNRAGRDAQSAKINGTRAGELGKFQQLDIATNKDEHPPIAIQETVPDEADGFDWVEQDFTNNDLSDGMAALSINPHGSGYFGSASSAVLLRALRIHPSSGTNINLERSTELYGVPILPLYPSPAPKHVADALLNAYFSIYHTSYPFIHEETFRAQYANQIARPAENVWEILFNTVLALGAWCLVNESSCADMAFFQNVKIRLTADVFETGSLPLVQALILLSNYVQKRNRPNTGWNFLGLAHRMATGLALHREFPGWKSSPLKLEMRRRTWWGLFMFDSGAAITFGRPISWPDHGGADVNEVSDINDSDLTMDTKLMPPSKQIGFTIYSGMIVQCRFHKATNSLYNRVISKPQLSAEQTLALASKIDSFVETLPTPFQESTPIPSDAEDWFVFARYRIYWRYHNLRILAFRPFVLQMALAVSGTSEKVLASILSTRSSTPQANAAFSAAASADGSDGRYSKSNLPMNSMLQPDSSEKQFAGVNGQPRVKFAFDESAAEIACRNRCMQDAHATILSVEDYIAHHKTLSTIAVWYALYFLFQAGLIPLLCFCSEPTSPKAPEWMQDIERTKAALAAVSSRNALADKFSALIDGLIGTIVQPQTNTTENPITGEPNGNSSVREINALDDMANLGANAYVDTTSANNGEAAASGLTMGDFEMRTGWLNDVYSLLYEDPTSASVMTGIMRDQPASRDPVIKDKFAADDSNMYLDVGIKSENGLNNAVTGVTMMPDTAGISVGADGREDVNRNEVEGVNGTDNGGATFGSFDIWN